MQINVTYDSSVANAPAGFKDCVAAACAFFDSTFTAPVTVNIQFGYGEIDGSRLSFGTIAQSEFNVIDTTYTQVRSALTALAAPGASTLPASDPTGLLPGVTTAEAKALGVNAPNDPAIDGWVGISATDSFGFDPNNRAMPGAYDLVGTLEHEISEVLGRTSGLDTPGGYMPLDLFRYDARGTLQLGQGGPSFFSIDDGATALAQFNNFATGDAGGDLGDWAPNTGEDSFRDEGALGVATLVTPTDITAMQAIGWTSSTSGAAPSGTIPWSNATSDYAGLPGGHFSVILPFASTSATRSLDADGGSVDMAYNNAAGNGSDTFTDIEFLQFSDKTIFVENADNADVARLYDAAFGRAPDVAGLSGWENIYTQVSAAAKGQGTYVSLAETPVAGQTSIAAGFTDSAEFQQKYGTLTDTAFVTQLYQNVLNRAPDQAGLNSWLTLMHQGDSHGQIYTREMVLVGFAESPENIAKVAADWLFQV